MEYSTLETDGRLALFVNSETPPDEEIPLHHYRYIQKEENHFQFYRLYRISYIQEKEGFKMKHSLYDWKAVECKKDCVAALKQMCDSMQAAIHFLTD